MYFGWSWVMVSLLWVVVLFWVVVGGRGFISRGGRFWLVYFGWWFVVASIFLEVVGGGGYFLSYGG